MGGQQSSMTNEEIFSNHSKINFVPSEPHYEAKTKTIGKLSGDECKLVESLCIGSLASGFQRHTVSRKFSLVSPLDLTGSSASVGQHQGNFLGQHGHRHSVHVLPRDHFHPGVFKNRRKPNSVQDLTPDHSSMSALNEDELDFVPPASPFRRGGFSSGSLRSKKSNAEIIPKDQRSRESLTRVFNTNLFFSHLDANERNEICDAMFRQTADAGDVIIKQGDEGDNFYIIDMGEVDVFIDEERVSSISQGGSFGELALIYGTPRAATIVSKTNSILWGIDRDSYRQILMESTIKKRELYDEFLSKIKIFENLYEWERMTVADALQEVTFDENEVVVKEGDDGDDFFIILDGCATVTQTDSATGETKFLSRLTSPEYFGEIALLLDQPRAATVTASENLKCVKLDRSRFERLLGPCSDILKRNMSMYNVIN